MVGTPIEHVQNFAKQEVQRKRDRKRERECKLTLAYIKIEGVFSLYSD